MQRSVLQSWYLYICHVTLATTVSRFKDGPLRAIKEPMVCFSISTTPRFNDFSTLWVSPPILPPLLFRCLLWELLTNGRNESKTESHTSNVNSLIMRSKKAVLVYSFQWGTVFFTSRRVGTLLTFLAFRSRHGWVNLYSGEWQMTTNMIFVLPFSPVAKEKNPL